MESTIAIVILNFNGKHHLESFLPSVVQHAQNAAIYVADNASTDDSISFLQSTYPGIKCLPLNRNFGFAGGYNVALTTLENQFDYYMILNSDVEVTENWLNPLKLFMDEHPAVAACQPKINSFQQKNSFEHAGATGGFIDRYYFPFCRGRIFDSVEEDEHQYDFEQQVTWTSGAAMLIRSKLFHESKGFDADFFAHMEEIDLCLRLGKLGHSFYCVPKSTVYHLGGGTLAYQSPRKTYLNFRNSLFMLMKNHSGFLLPILFIRMSLDGIAALKFFLSGQWKNAWMIFMAHLNFYAQIGRFYQKRRLLKLQNQGFFRYTGSIIVDFYLRNNKRFSQLNKRKFIQ